MTLKNLSVRFCTTKLKISGFEHLIIRRGGLPFFFLDTSTHFDTLRQAQCKSSV